MWWWPVMALGLSEATQLSLEWWSWFPGRPDRCWTWRCSASGAISARRRSVLTPHQLSFLDWWEVHQSSCGQNFIGSSGTMEKEGALTIWKRSIEKHELRYTTMISDGDWAIFPALSRAEPYGKNHLISKQECVGHVKKRMMSHLKDVKLKPHFSHGGKRREGSPHRQAHEAVPALLWEGHPLTP